jgi:hypothetical protein
MIYLERKEPQIVTKIEALIGRLSENFGKLDLIKKDYASFKAGYQGEKRIDYYFSLMDQNKYDFYHGIRLFNGKDYFQIDPLIVSNYFILADEIKNLSGTIIFNKKDNQFTQNNRVITNPFSQVKLQKLQFTDWLERHRFPPFPVDTLITMANPSTKIEAPLGFPDNYWKLGYGHDLINKINIYEKSYKKELIPNKERRRLKKLLLKYHTPLEVNVLRKYGVTKGDIIPGVKCPPPCLFIPMTYNNGVWSCPKCLHQSIDAYKNDIKNYFLIFGPTITNKEYREFTGVQSRYTATRHLSALSLPHTGTNKGRIYYSPDYKPEQNKEQ